MDPEDLDTVELHAQNMACLRTRIECALVAEVLLGLETTVLNDFKCVPLWPPVC